MTRKNTKLLESSSCIHGASSVGIPKSHVFFTKNVIEYCYNYFNNFGLVSKIVQILKGLEEWLEDKIQDAKKDVELAYGESCLIPKARLDAFEEMLEHVKRL